MWAALTVCLVVLAILFALVVIGVTGLALAVILSKEAPPAKVAAAPVRAGPSDETAAEYARYQKLLREMMLYSAHMDVVFHQEIEAYGDGFLFMRTTSDRFGKRRYVERQRAFGAALNCTLCRYDDGEREPSESAMADWPATQVDWSTYYQNIRDIRDNGSKLSFWDAYGRHRQERVPKRVERRI